MVNLNEGDNTMFCFCDATLRRVNRMRNRVKFFRREREGGEGRETAREEREKEIQRGGKRGRIFRIRSDRIQLVTTSVIVP